VLNEENRDVLVFIGREHSMYDTISRFLHSRGIIKIKDIYILHPIFNNAGECARLANEFRAENIRVPAGAGNCFYSGWFIAGLKGVKIRKTSGGDIIPYRNFEIIVKGPARLYDDIRKNFMEIEIKGKRNILMEKLERLSNWGK